MQIHIRRGLNVPFIGQPSGPIKPLPRFETQALDLSQIRDVKWVTLKEEGETVKIGESLVYDKRCERHGVSPASGTITKIVRGEKRRLESIIIERGKEDVFYERPALKLDKELSREKLVEALRLSGLLLHIKMRPADILANPKDIPRSIFIQAVDTTPFSPPIEHHLRDNKSAFLKGIEVLKRLTDGRVHLVHAPFDRSLFGDIDVTRHEVSGPHPAGLPSFHIARIDPIRSRSCRVWTAFITDVITIGHFVESGRYHTQIVVGVGGEGASQPGYYSTLKGAPLSAFTASLPTGNRLIKGDPLTGQQAGLDGHLGLQDRVVSILKEKVEERKLLSFFRWSLGKYSFTRNYFSSEKVSLDTNQHGEERPFVDGSIYDKVMPLPISTTHLVKAILSGDFERAEALGLLEVAPEDFALPSFVCPSKIDMISILKKAFSQYSQQYL